MDYDAKTVGQSLQQVPIADMIKSYASGIADAQWALDQKSIELAKALLTTKLTLPDSEGTPRERSLLELGFAPTFYQFQEATIEIAVSLTMKVEQSFSIGIGLSGSYGRSTPTQPSTPSQVTTPPAAGTDSGTGATTPAAGAATGAGAGAGAPAGTPAGAAGATTPTGAGTPAGAATGTPTGAGAGTPPAGAGTGTPP
ncbi:MAG: hypothetical protein HUU38_19635 [Anaerolineales bacterium]|nr:hypothetical protein [Anaerolineales bacterium]